jgi:hypothetical protein
MDTQLIEISNRSLFTEYLNHFGIKAPSLQQEWVYTKDKRVLARISMDDDRARFFISASRIGV